MANKKQAYNWARVRAGDIVSFNARIKFLRLKVEISSKESL